MASSEPVAPVAADEKVRARAFVYAFERAFLDEDTGDLCWREVGSLASSDYVGSAFREWSTSDEGETAIEPGWYRSHGEYGLVCYWRVTARIVTDSVEPADVPDLRGELGVDGS